MGPSAFLLLVLPLVVTTGLVICHHRLFTFWAIESFTQEAACLFSHLEDCVFLFSSFWRCLASYWMRHYGTYFDHYQWSPPIHSLLTTQSQTLHQSHFEQFPPTLAEGRGLKTPRQIHSCWHKCRGLSVS